MLYSIQDWFQRDLFYSCSLFYSLILHDPDLIMYIDVITKFGSNETIETLRFFVFERTLSQPRRHLRSHLAMQRPSSEATTSCPNRDAPALPEHDQRAVISFF